MKKLDNKQKSKGDIFKTTQEEQQHKKQIISELMKNQDFMKKISSVVAISDVKLEKHFENLSYKELSKLQNEVISEDKLGDMYYQYNVKNLEEDTILNYVKQLRLDIKDISKDRVNNDFSQFLEETIKAISVLNLETFDIKSIIKNADNAQRQSLEKTFQFLQKLQDISQSKIKKDDILELVKEYRAFSVLSNSLAEEALGTQSLFDNQNIVLTFLFQATSVSLLNQINTLDLSKIKNYELLKIKAIADSIDLLANSMAFSNDYNTLFSEKVQKDNIDKVLGKTTKTEHDNKINEIALREKYIIQGLSFAKIENFDTEKDDRWLISDYLEEIKQDMGKDFEELGRKDFASKVQKYQMNARENKILLKDVLHQDKNFTSLVTSNFIFDELFNLVQKNLGFKLILGDLKTGSALLDTIKIVFEEQKENIDKFNDRLSKFTVTYKDLYSYVKNSEVGYKMFTLDDIEYEEFLNSLKAQIDLNIQVLEESLEGVPSVSKNQLRKRFMDKNSSGICKSSIYNFIVLIDKFFIENNRIITKDRKILASKLANFGVTGEYLEDFEKELKQKNIEDIKDIQDAMIEQFKIQNVTTNKKKNKNKPKIPTAVKITYKDLLKKGLLDSPEFNGEFDSFEDTFITALEKLILNGKLTGVNSILDLQNISSDKFNKLLDSFKININKYFKDFEKINTYAKQEVKGELIYHILAGELTLDQFGDRVKEISSFMERADKSQENKLKTILLANNYDRDKAIFSTLNQKKSTTLEDNKSRIERRIKRLQENKTLKEYIPILVNSMEEEFNNLRRQNFDGLMKITEKKIKEREKNLKVALGLINSSSKVLIKPTDNGYEERMNVMKNAKGILLNIEDTLEKNSDKAILNKESYGVYDFQEFLQKASTIFDANTIAESTKVSKLYDGRVKEFFDKNNQILKPILPQILSLNETYKILTAGTDTQVEDYYNKIYKNAKAPLELIAKRYGEFDIIREQFYYKYGKEIIEVDMDEEYMQLEFSKFYNDIMSFGGVEKPLKDQLKKYINLKNEDEKVVSKYLGSILSIDGMEILKDKKKMEAYIDRIKSNEKSFNDFCKSNNLSEENIVGFNLFINKEIVAKAESEFLSELMSNLNKYVEFNDTQLKEIAKTQSVLDKKSAILNEIQSKKQEGQNDFEYFKEKIDETQDLISNSVSPLAYKSNIDMNNIDLGNKRIKKLKKDIKDTFDSFSDTIKAILLETRILNITEDTNELEKLALGLKDAEDLIDSNGLLGNSVPSEILQEFLQYININAVKTANLTYDLPTLESNFKDFIEKKAKFLKFKELGQEIDSSSILAIEYDQLLSSTAYLVYTMENSEFSNFIDKQTKVMETSILSLNIFEEVLKNYDIPQEQYKDIKVGLRDYFYSEILDGSKTIDKSAFSVKVSNLLADKDSLQYIKNSEHLLDSVSKDGEKKEVFTLNSSFDFEKFIEENSSKSDFEKFGELDTEQKRIFALVLSSKAILDVPDVILSSMQISNLDVIKIVSDSSVLAQIKNYVNYEEFAPQIDYIQAKHTLINKKGKINSKQFSKALKKTKEFSKARDENLELSERLTTSAFETIRLIGGNVKIPEVNSLQQLKSTLVEYEPKNKVLKKISEMNDTDFKLLAMVLQDRTLIDVTTKDDSRDFVNQDKREEMLLDYRLKGEEFTSYQMSDDEIKQALYTALSYQIKDDMLILNDETLTKEHIAKKALSRKTDVDIDMLDRAYDFVKELKEYRVGLLASKEAINLIEHSKNENAKKEYQDYKNRDIGQRELDDFFVEQAQKDGEFAILSGYLSLDENEKSLFIKALSNRDILDISKTNINMNRLGRKERDYVNQKSRDALMDEFMTDEKIFITDDAYKDSLLTTLSTQVSDSISIKELSSDLTKSLSKGGIFKDTRNTAVDWKLFKRALQIVNRAKNESDIKKQDEALYLAFSDISKFGQFDVDTSNMRKNIHNSGNRFTRFLARRTYDVSTGIVSDIIEKKVPLSFMKDMASKGLKYIPDNVYLKVSNSSIAKALSTEDKGGKDIENIFTKIADQIDEKANLPNIITGNENIQELAKKIGQEEGFETFKGFVENATKGTGYLQKGVTILDRLYKTGELAIKTKEANKVEQDDVDMVLSGAIQGDIYRDGLKRNLKANKTGTKYAHEKLGDEIVSAVSSLFSSDITRLAPDEFSTLIETVSKETFEFVNLIRGYIADKRAIHEFFEIDEEISKYRQKLASIGINFDEKVNNIKFFCQAKGFENEDELASFVGFNIVQSLLYSAGSQNALQSTKIRAVAALVAIGCKEFVGRVDSDAAAEVYNSLINQNYR